MKYIIKAPQKLENKVLTTDGIRLKLIGRGNTEIQERVEKLIGESRFYKVTDGQVIKFLNGASPHINYYLTEADLKTLKQHDLDDVVTGAVLIRS